MRIEVLQCPGCDHAPQVLPLVEAVLRGLAVTAAVEVVLVETVEQAERRAFPGSPTVRIDDRDVDPDPPAGVGLG